MSGNPFDGFDTYSNVAQPVATLQQSVSPQRPPQPPGDPFAAPPAPPTVPNHVNPFFAGQPPPAAPPPPPAPQQHTYPPQMMQPQQPPQMMQPQQYVQQPQQMGTSQPLNQQQLVPMAPNPNQSSWAIQPAGAPAQRMIPMQTAPAPASQSFDPFAASPQPPPPPRPPIPQQQYGNQPPQQQQQFSQQLVPAQPSPFGVSSQQPYNNYTLTAAAAPPPVQPSPQRSLNQEGTAVHLQTQQSGPMPDGDDEEGLDMIDVELDDDPPETDDRKKDGEFLGAGAADSEWRTFKGSGSGARSAPSWDRNADIAPPPKMKPGRRNAEQLSLKSGGVTSQLPNPNLIVHAGYVLSRISFRTVLMRKWKQTFWIQYGPTMLLFFRSYSDYEDWLNNPYHSKKAREFLVKLRVDFISDLKKSSVMGYQVTQVRRKPYGKNVMLHFKLERWMDYGPTIAAAFAAREEEMVNSPHNHGRAEKGEMNTSNDVAALRKIILGCMRNARDAAVIASQRQHDASGGAETAGHRGRYDGEVDRDSRRPSGGSNANLGFHQAFSAESTERRGAAEDDDVKTESSAEAPAAAREPAAPMIDLLG